MRAAFPPATWCRPRPRTRTGRPTVMHRVRNSRLPLRQKETHAMPSAPLAGNAVTGTGDQAGALGTRAPAPVTPGHAPRKAHRARLRRVSGLLRRVPTIGGRYDDPLFERPDLIEDDYYRLRPHG